MEMGSGKEREKLWLRWEWNPRPSHEIRIARPTELQRRPEQAVCIEIATPLIDYSIDFQGYAVNFEPFDCSYVINGDHFGFFFGGGGGLG